LDAKRKAALTRAIKIGYTTDQLRSAVDGCMKSAWHQGDNKDGKVYDAITLIFRDAEHIERFIGYSKNPPAGRSTQSNGPVFDNDGQFNPEVGRAAHQIL
jgi:hypothetical protein